MSQFQRTKDIGVFNVRPHSPWVCSHQKC